MTLDLSTLNYMLCYSYLCSLFVVMLVTRKRDE